MTIESFSGIILAGDAGRHPGAGAAASIEDGGRQVLDHLVDVIKPLVGEILLVTTDPLVYLAWDLTLVRDGAKRSNALTGLYAGLFAASAPNAVVLTCDTPPLQPKVVQQLMSTAAPRWDAVLPASVAGALPFPGIYSRRCLKLIQNHLADDQFSLETLMDRAHHTTVAIVR